MNNFFRRIQWKLTISYAIVTAGTVIVLAALLVGVAFYFEFQNNWRTHDSFYWSKTAFQDNIPFLLDDPKAMQTWLARVQKSGFILSDFQSNTVRETLDYANSYLTGTAIYVLDPQLNLLAAVPPVDSALINKPFNPRPLYGVGLEAAIENAQTGTKQYETQSLLQPDGRYISAFPLRKSDGDPVAAIIIYELKPLSFATPTNLWLYQTFFTITMVIMFIVSLPVGAVFGWLVSRNLRKRLISLSASTKAWSTGDFSVVPTDSSGDEIGELTRHLKSMADQLQTLLNTRNELTRIEERNRLARDLHDTVKQQNYAERMQLSAAKNLVEGDPKTAGVHIEAALQLNRETQQELKLIIEELRPAAFEGKGLSQALSEYITRWQENTGIKVETIIRGDRPLPFAVEQTLYRIFQESLSNIARHAQADAVTVTLDMDQSKTSLTIKDNGRGFEPAAVESHSFGLNGMKQRLAEINGSLRVETQVSVGTSIFAEAKF